VISGTSSFTRLGLLSYIRPHLHHVQPVFEAVSVSVLNTCAFTVFFMWYMLRDTFWDLICRKHFHQNLFQFLCAACFMLYFYDASHLISFHYFDCILFDVNDNWWCQTSIFVHHTFGLAYPWIICSLLLIFFLFVPMFVLILATYNVCTVFTQINAFFWI